MPTTYVLRVPRTELKLFLLSAETLDKIGKVRASDLPSAKRDRCYQFFYFTCRYHATLTVLSNEECNHGNVGGLVSKIPHRMAHAFLTLSYSKLTQSLAVSLAFNVPKQPPHFLTTTENPFPSPSPKAQPSSLLCWQHCRHDS